MKPNYAVRVREHVLDLYFTDEVYYYETIEEALRTYDIALIDGRSVSLWERIEKPNQNG